MGCRGDKRSKGLQINTRLLHINFSRSPLLHSLLPTPIIKELINRLAECRMARSYRIYLQAYAHVRRNRRKTVCLSVLALILHSRYIPL